MQLRRIILALFLLSVACLGQAVRFDAPLLTIGPGVRSVGGPLPQMLGIANATVSVCQHPATINSCVPVATYTDSTMATSCLFSTPLVQLPGTLCTASTGPLAKIGWWYAGGIVDYFVTSQFGSVGPYTVNNGVATNLASPGPIGGTTPSTGNFTSITAGTMLPELLGTVYQVDGFPSSCTVNSVSYTTELDCAFQTAVQYVTTSGQDATLVLGVGLYQTCAGLTMPAVYSTGTNLRSVSILGQGNSEPGGAIYGQTVIQQSCALTSPAVIYKGPSLVADKWPAGMNLKGFDIDANNYGPAMQLFGFVGSHIEHITAANVPSGATNYIQLGDTSGSTLGGGYENYIDNLKITGSHQPGMGAVLTPTISGGSLTGLTVSGGTGYLYPTVVFYGFGTGTQPCAVMPTATITQTGGVPNAPVITNAGSGCTGTLDVNIQDIVPVTYGIQIGITDSTFKDIVTAGAGTLQAIAVYTGANTFLHPHPYGGSATGILDSGKNTYVTPEFDGILQYGIQFAGTGSQVIGPINVSPYATPGYSTAYYYGAAVNNHIIATGRMCSSSTDYHLQVTISGPVDSGQGELGNGNSVIGNQACNTATQQSTSFNEAVAINAPSPATSSTSYVSQPVLVCGSLWNGTQAQRSCWQQQHTTLQTGSTPTGEHLDWIAPSMTNQQNFDILASQVATSGANWQSPKLALFGNFWNGSSSQQDNWAHQVILGTGTNPTTTLTWTHGGTNTGQGYFQIPSNVAFQWALDTSITRTAAKTFAFGNGTFGDATGTLNAAGFNGILGSVTQAAANVTALSLYNSSSLASQLTTSFGSTSVLLIDVIPSATTGNANIRHFRLTNATGGALETWYQGNNTNTPTAQINAATGQVEGNEITTCGSVSTGTSCVNWTAGAGVPSGNCPVGSMYSNASASSTSTVFYMCYPANTWNAVTIP